MISLELRRDLLERLELVREDSRHLNPAGRVWPTVARVMVFGRFVGYLAVADHWHEYYPAPGNVLEGDLPPQIFRLEVCCQDGGFEESVLWIREVRRRAAAEQTESEGE